jgi:aspartyl-tRNA(Asn)/glutamyl-tRNA(Gln) amidotransferase subunit C
MAAVTREEVIHIAKLARLKFKDEELDSFIEQFNKIIGYIDTLNELDTKNIKPTLHVVDIKNVFREDVVKPSFSQDEILSNAPDKKDCFFIVPKVL